VHEERDSFSAGGAGSSQNPEHERGDRAQEWDGGAAADSGGQRRNLDDRTRCARVRTRSNESQSVLRPYTTAGRNEIDEPSSV
jgi:hypothetical protein